MTAQVTLRHNPARKNEISRARPRQWRSCFRSHSADSASPSRPAQGTSEIAQKKQRPQNDRPQQCEDGDNYGLCRTLT